MLTLGLLLCAFTHDGTVTSESITGPVHFVTRDLDHQRANRPYRDQLPNPAPPGGTDVKVNKDPGNSPQNETSMAVNPLDPLNIIGSANDYRTGNVQSGHYASLDGGQTWVDGVFAVKPGYSFSGDCCVAFDDLGNAYEVVMQYFGAQGSAVYIYKSTDGGIHWDNGTLIDVNGANDKPQVDIDLSGGPFHGTIYVAWDRFGAPGGDHIYMSYSRNQGATWSTAARVNDSTSVVTISPDVAVGANSAVYIMWADRGTNKKIYVDRSFDGGATFGTDVLVATFNAVPSPFPGSSFRNFDIFTIGADQTGGPYQGNVYVAWHNWETGNPRHADIRFSRSTDSGATWSPSIVVNDDTSKHDQFYPWIAVDPNGNCNVMFYDRRDDPNDYLIHTYVARSSDGGASFRPNVKASDVSWDHAGDFGGGFIGDYNGVGSSAQALHPLWTDGRSGGQDLYSDAVHLNFFSDVAQISVATGGSAVFAINPGPNYGGMSYWMFGSLSGTSPGIDFGHGVVLPLNFDPFFLITITAANSPGLVNSSGTLDLTGSAVCTLNTGGPLPPSFAGIRLYFATLVSNPLPVFATNASTLDLVP